MWHAPKQKGRLSFDEQNLNEFICDSIILTYAFSNLKAKIVLFCKGIDGLWRSGLRCCTMDGLLFHWKLHNNIPRVVYQYVIILNQLLKA